MKKTRTILPINECVIFQKIEDGKSYIGKNRDRTYFSTVKIERSVYNGIEIVVLVDNDTKWMEGMNSLGTGVVNSALLVGFDEKAKKMAKKDNIISSDGIIIRESLKMPDIETTILCLKAHMGGVRGHSIISNDSETYTIESSTYHDSISNKRDHSPIGIARTNHGHEFSGIIGYTSGEDFRGSILRKDQMMRNLKNRSNNEDWFETMSKTNYEKNTNYNIKREKVPGTFGKMSTTSQMVMNLSDLEMHLNIITKYGEFDKFENLSKDIDNKIKVFLYEDGKPKKEW